jgi:hypothetical protein
VYSVVVFTFMKSGSMTFIKFCGFVAIIFFPLSCLPPKQVNELPYARNHYRVSQGIDQESVERGWDYIYYGGYIGSGYPASFVLKEDELEKAAIDKDYAKTKLGYDITLFEDLNGVKVINNNCFTCHAGVLNDSIVFGLGNYNSEFAKSPGLLFPLIPVIMQSKVGKKSAEYQSFKDIWRFQRAVSPKIVTHFNGPNPAFRLEEVCAAHRDPVTLAYKKKPTSRIKGKAPSSDIPPLWNVQYKNLLYYNGMGKGDLSKLLMQASVLGLKDTTQARQVQQSFQDVVSWVLALEAPVYPEPVDMAMAIEGKRLFNEHCSQCHGTYDKDVIYPGKIIPIDKIGTDPYYALYFAEESKLSEWYNESWYATTVPYSQMKPQLGYIAPPLVGIWASAPYFHNGSVPTLEQVLSSKSRPRYWRKDGGYNTMSPGLKYTSMNKKRKDKAIYNTDIRGYSNTGHTYGDVLTGQERRSIVEYLKTL